MKPNKDERLARKLFVLAQAGGHEAKGKGISNRPKGFYDYPLFRAPWGTNSDCVKAGWINAARYVRENFRPKV